jgi:hypothetical protein
MDDQIPNYTNEKWQALVLGLLHLDFEFFPVKLLLARLQLKVKLNPSEESISDCTKELRELFVKNVHIPKAKRDLNKIFKKKFSFFNIFKRR